MKKSSRTLSKQSWLSSDIPEGAQNSKTKSLYIPAEADYVLNYGLIPNPQEQTENLLAKRQKTEGHRPQLLFT